MAIRVAADQAQDRSRLLRARWLQRVDEVGIREPSQSKYASCQKEDQDQLAEKKKPNLL